MALISEAVTSSEPSQSTPCPSPSPRSARISARPSANVDDADREVDEEDPVPAQRLGEQPAGEQAERAAGDRDEHVRAHRAGALGGLRELGDDDREDHRRLGGGADALQQARADQRALRRGDAAQQRRDGERDEAGEEHALAPDEVAEPAGQQQQAAERDEERVDDPGQVRLAEVEVAAGSTGSATFTIVTSSTIISCARQTTTSVAQRRRSAAGWRVEAERGS